jgi:hypothetical protein
VPEAPVGRRLCCLPEHADGLTPFCKVCRRLLPDGVHACVTPGRCEPGGLPVLKRARDSRFREPPQ